MLAEWKHEELGLDISKQQQVPCDDTSQLFEIRGFEVRNEKMATESYLPGMCGPSYDMQVVFSMSIS